MLTHIELEDLMNNLNLYPGFKFKVASLYNHLRKVLIDKQTNRPKPNTTTRLRGRGSMNRVFSMNSTRSGLSPTSMTLNSRKPMSVQTYRSNNKIVSSFLNTGGFGFKYYLEDKKEDVKSGEENLKPLTKPSEQKSTKADNNLNEEIDKLLNFYMGQLNEKVDDSNNPSDDGDDSSLENFQSINKYVNKNNFIKQEDEITVEEGISEIKRGRQSASDNVSSMRDVLEKTKNDVVIGNNISSFTHTGIGGDTAVNDIIEDEVVKNTVPKGDSSLMEELDIDNIEEDILEEERPKLEETAKSNRVASAGGNIRIQSAGGNIRIQSAKDKGRILSGRTNYANNEEVKVIKEVAHEEPLSKTTPKKSRYDEDDDDYGDIRLTKSCEEGYIRQNMDHFDIEYMCRCLGLALMKHLESSQDNQHILDLVNTQEKFSFFSSLYNTNFSFLTSFFNFEDQANKLSNLDRLDLNEYKEKESIQKVEQPISFVSHMTTTGVEGEEVVTKPTFKKEFDVDIKMINDYFRNPRLNLNKYKGVTDNTKNILLQELNSIGEVDSVEFTSNNLLKTLEHKSDKADYIDVLKQSVVLFSGKDDEDEEVKEEYTEEIELTPFVKKDNKFTNYNIEEGVQQTEGIGINEDIAADEQGEVFESGAIESNYLIDVATAEKLKNYLLKSVELYDDDYEYTNQALNPHRRYINPPDPQIIYEFCANIMILSKMEKEVIIISLIYIERFIFNTGLLLTSRNWKRLLFTAMIVASKIWDDDSFENNHFAQVFTHLSIGEINMMERVFLELINYKVYVKCSDYFKYFFIIKSIALKYNFNGLQLVPISVEKMMKIQEYAYTTQKKLRKKYSYNNSAEF
jgi:hypothetical protein